MPSTTSVSESKNSCEDDPNDTSGENNRKLNNIGKSKKTERSGTSGTSGTSRSRRSETSGTSSVSESKSVNYEKHNELETPSRSETHKPKLDIDSEDDDMKLDPYSEKQIVMAIDNILKETRNPCVGKRDSFLNNPRLIVEEKRSPLTNMVDQIKSKCYNIDEANADEFMTIMNDCLKAKVNSGLAERQTEPSGIMIDLDLLVSKKRSYLEKFTYHKITDYVVKTLSSMLKIGSVKKTNEIIVVYLRKPEVVYSEKHKSYKDGIHILLPGVQVSKNFKRYFLAHIKKDGGIKKILKDTKYTNLDDCVDQNAANVFVLLYGCVKNEGMQAYHMEMAHSAVIDESSPMIEDCTEKLNKSINLVYDLSLSWQCPGGVITKKQYKYKESIENVIDSWNDRHKEKILDETELENTQNSLSTLCVQDPDVRYYKTLLEIVDVEKATERNMWWKIINIFAQTHNEKFKTLVYYFSQRCPEKYTKEAVDETWEQCQNQKYETTIRMLERWAKEDSPEKFAQLKKSSAFEILQVATFEFKGIIKDAIVAQILHTLLRTKYAVGISSNKRAMPEWYEFITKEDSHKPGEVFKYRYLSRPVNINRYISDALPKLYTRMLDHLKYCIEKEGDQNTQKYLIDIKKKLEKSKTDLIDETFKSKVISSASNLFFDPNFLDKLDRDGGIMGVGNGILLLGSEIKLINHYHEWTISRYTSTVYKPFDKRDEWVNRIYNAFRDIIPEEDAFEKLMYYFCLGLNGETKDSIILFLVGGGANGKSFLLEMISNAIGDKYARKLPISFITGGRGEASNSNPALMELKYARMIYYSEPNACTKINIGLLKEILGQEKMSGRGHFSDQENFRPSCIHISASNYDYEIDTSDFGTWRRIMYYRCKVKFISNPKPKNKYEKKENPAFGKSMTTNTFALEATLSILSHFYEKLYRIYNGHIKNVKSPTIERESMEFQNRQDCVNEFICQMVIKIDDPKDTPVILLSNMAELYNIWYVSNKSPSRVSNIKIIEELKNSRIAQYIIIDENTGSASLAEHRVKENPGEAPREGETPYLISNMRKDAKIKPQFQKRQKLILENTNKELKAGKVDYAKSAEESEDSNVETSEERAKHKKKSHESKKSKKSSKSRKSRESDISESKIDYSSEESEESEESENGEYDEPSQSSKSRESKKSSKSRESETQNDDSDKSESQDSHDSSDEIKVVKQSKSEESQSKHTKPRTMTNSEWKDTKKNFMKNPLLRAEPPVIRTKYDNNRKAQYDALTASI